MYQLLCCIIALSSLTKANWGFYPSHGQTQLLGTSFGIPGTNASFDYVIIGGGTSGLTVAKRLLETGSYSVAVIEGGSFYEINNGNRSQVPGYAGIDSGSALNDVQILVDWGINTTPQPQLDNRMIHYTQGKCFGGSSARNYMAYQRGTIGSYQDWANNVNSSSFTFNNLLRYFKKSPHFTPPNYTKRGAGGPIPYNPSAFASSGGPLQVSYSNWYDPVTSYLHKAMSSLGLSEIAGLNSGELIGYAEFTNTIDNTAATRSSSETSFLRQSIQGQSNLQLYQQSVASKILFDENKNAIGVDVITDTLAYPLTYSLMANKEVILAAGAFRSPQMLLVSGIGPAATLQSLGIPVIADRPGVGQNMWDQPLTATVWEVNTSTLSQLGYDPAYVDHVVVDFITNQTGPLVSAGGNVVAWEKLPQDLRANFTNTTSSDLAAFPADWPELEILPGSGAFIALPKGSNASANYYSLQIGQMVTTSRGNVTINTTDTRQNPVVSSNFLLTETDQQLAVGGLRRVRQIMEATGIVLQEVLPGPSVQTDEEILAFIKSVVGTIHHASAACKMGIESDPMAVVGTTGKVYGVSGLRIVDISAFNLLPPGHPQATVYALAEKYADDIKQGH